mmetsp:Transcript_13650/g.22406  ORF Transcript_13650/g.22406 Transcript_13650/m.22406 type:complete len:87 (+) Transcript_13650:138-398(+)
MQEWSKQLIHLEPMSQRSESRRCPSKTETGMALGFVLERSLPPNSDAVSYFLNVEEYIKRLDGNVEFLFGFRGKSFWLIFDEELGG